MRLVALILLISCSCAISSAQIVTSNLVAQYAMTDASGATLPDTSGNGNNGTLVNGPVIGSEGITFTKASSQYITLPIGLSTTVKTIEIFADCDRRLEGGRAALLGSSDTVGLKIYCGVFGTGADKFIGVEMGTKLTSAISASDTSITLNSVERIPAGTFFTIDSETVTCTSLAGTTYSGCSRAQIGTTAASHSIGAPVVANVVGGTVSQSTSLFASYFSAKSPSLITASLGSTNSRLLDNGVETMYGGFYSTPTPSRPFTTANNSGQWQIGGDTGEFFSGTIYYVLMYSDQESNANVAQNSTALATIMSGRSVPARTDAGSTNNVLVCEGTSIEVFGPWCTGMTLSGISASDIMVTAQSGGVYTNITQYTVARDGPLTDPTASRNVMVLGAPTNDLVSNSAASTEATYQTVISQVKAEGYTEVYCGLMLSRNGTGFGGATMDDLHDTWNTWLLTNYVSAGCTNVIQWDGRFTADGAWNNPNPTACGGSACFSGDGIHPSSAGFSAMSALAQPVINGGTLGSTVRIQDVTAQQAIIGLKCGIGPCTVIVYDSAGNQVDDTNESLFTGSTAATRVGSVAGVNGRITFVAGLRTAQKALDGLMHSRSLAALTSYKAVITDTGNSATTTIYFTTANVPSGNLYPEQPPFDANGFGNAAYPSVDVDGTGGCGNFLGNGKPCIDPVTGLQYWLFTTPGAHSGIATPSNSTTKFQTPAISAGTCDVPANMVNSPAVNFANCSGALVATMTAGTWSGPNVYRPTYPYGISYAATYYNPLYTVDDMIVVISGSADDNIAGDDQVQVSLQGVAGCTSNTFTITLPVGSTGTFYAPHGTSVNLPKPYWQDWGCVPNQGYAAAPQIKVQRVGSGATVNLSVWFEAAVSSNWFNYESIPMRCEDTPRTIAYDRSGGAISPSLNGYICYVGTYNSPAEVWLWIPFNADGSVRAESRWLGTSSGSYSGFSGFNFQIMGVYGADLYGGNMFTAPFDAWKLSYNTGLHAWCNYQDLRTLTDPVTGGWYPSNTNFNAQPAPCFTYTQITSNSKPTILAAWSALHPDFSDTTNWIIGAPYFRNGVIAFVLVPTPNSGNPMQIFGFYNTAGTLTGVSDNFTNRECHGGSGPTCSGGTWVSKPGWSVSHGQILGEPGGAYAEISVEETPSPGDATSVWNGVWKIPVLAVNRAGFGASAQWDCPTCTGGATLTTEIAPNEYYQCPNTALTRKLCPLGGGAGSCCIEVQVNQEPCSTTPYVATNTFAGNTKNEAQQYPCTKTDNTTVVNAAWSKLQNSQEGDWVAENGGDANWEAFVIAQKTLDGGGNVNGLWLVREANPTVNSNLWAPLNPHVLNIPGVTGYHPCTNYGAGCPPTATAWSLMMRGSYTQNPAGTYAFPVASPSTPLFDNPTWSGCHHEDGLTVRAACGGTGYLTVNYAGIGFASTIGLPGKTTVPYLPLFAGSTGTPTASYNVQSYQAAAQNTAAATLVPGSFLSWRHLNSSFGGTPFQPSGFCNQTATRISGDIYKLSGSDCFNNPADPKHLPFVARANPYLLRDVSGPSSVGSFSGTSMSACYALTAGECMAGSTAGSYYVNVANVSPGNCNNLYSYTSDVAGYAPYPCFYEAGAVAGRLQQIDSGRTSSDGANSRSLSFAHTIPGAVPQQAYPSWDSTGRFALVSGGIIDGKRYDVMAILVPPLQYDSVARTAYVPVTVTYTGGSVGDTRQICIGYAENAPGYDPSLGLYPMPRQESGCSDGTGASVFNWQTTEVQHPTSCASGCSITVNLIAGRVAYLQAYLRGSKSGPLRVIAVH